MGRIWGNFIYGTLGTAMSATDTTVQCSALSNLPAVSAPDTANIVVDAANASGHEIMTVTAHAAGSSSATVTRGVDGTTAVIHAAGVIVAQDVLVSDMGLPAYLTGATASARFAGGTTSGPPTSGTFAVGDWVSGQDGSRWVCTVAGSPGTWIPTAPVMLGSVSATGGGTVSFTSIPQYFTDLRVTWKGQGATNDGALAMRLNSDAGNNYDYTLSQSTSASSVPIGGGASETGNVAGVGTVGTALGSTGVIEIPQYRVTANRRIAFSRCVLMGSISPFLTHYLFAAGWRNSAAITRIDLFGNMAGGLAAGSTFTLWGQ